MIKYLTFSFSIAIISWIVGMIGNAVIVKTEFYNKHLSHLNFLKNKMSNKIIGVGIIKWIVKNTPFKFFNQKLTIKKKIEINDLHTLRKEMTIAEISHLIGFVFMAIFALVKASNGFYMLAVVMMLINTLMNLYPSLLQQENKRRIDILRRRFKSIL